MKHRLLTWSDTEESRLWVDGSQLPLAVVAHPCNVVPDTRHLVARQSGCHHGQVGLPTRARERSGKVLLLSLCILNTKNLQTL